MSKIPTPAITAGFVASSKQALGHAADAGKSAVGAGKDIAVSANSRLAGHLSDKGVWGTMKHGAGKYPLVVGAAGVTAATVAAYKVMGPRENDIRMQRAASQEQGMQR